MLGKGLVIATAGALVVVAACRSEPKTGHELDGALTALGSQPYGRRAVAASIGIVTYGLYSFVMARSTRM